MTTKFFPSVEDAREFLDVTERESGVKYIRRSTTAGFATGGKYTAYLNK